MAPSDTNLGLAMPRPEPWYTRLLTGTPGLLFGAVGIIGCFGAYGSLLEDVMGYKDENGLKFTYVWTLQVIEALANAAIGFLGMTWAGRTPGLPINYFLLSGTTQVFAKACYNFAMRFGLAFAIATLAKSAKMLPVMVGGIFIGGKVYPLRQYFQVLAIIMGTVLVTMYSSKKGSDKTNSALGFVFISLSLVCDGLTGGVQDRVKMKCKERDVKVKPFDMMFWTNFFMLWVALLFACIWPTDAGSVQMVEGISYIMSNPDIMLQIVKFAFCSAFGQCFIFFVVANFGALKCSTITTCRKIFSVLYSIFTKGYDLENMGWFGLILGTAGIVGEFLPEKPHAERREVAPVQPGPINSKPESELATSTSDLRGASTSEMRGTSTSDNTVTNSASNVDPHKSFSTTPMLEEQERTDR